MFALEDMKGGASTLISLYASLNAAIMLIRTMSNELIPDSVRSYIWDFLTRFFSTPSSTGHTIIIEEQAGLGTNQIYESAEIYLNKMFSPTADKFKVNKTQKQKSINIIMEKGQEITDTFRNIRLNCRFVLIEPNEQASYQPEKRFYELTFEKKYKETVLKDYLPFVIEKAKQIKEEEKTVKLFTMDCPYMSDDYDCNAGAGGWGCITLDHPASFDTLAMDPDKKRDLIEDLNRFLKRRDYYRRVGKAWKRGYLLYGPPGTGKSTLIAAMANYLKFDIFDLELTRLSSDSELRRILVTTTNRSILVIEDIDCSVEMHDRQQLEHETSNSKLTLSGLLNFIDGLWSSCGDERVIFFTTNYKEKIDPALLRPGRMDMHIHMSYCTVGGFRTLVGNYLGIDKHKYFDEIDSLLENVEATPAEIAEQLMRSEDTDLALEGVLDFLKKRKYENVEVKEEKIAFSEAKDVKEESADREEEVHENERKKSENFLIEL